MRPPVLSGIPEHVDTLIDFLSSDLSPPREYPIVIHKCDQYPPKYILYNSEQMTCMIRLKKVVADAAREGCVEVWDYSAANVGILALNGVVARHVPLQCSEAYLSQLRAYRAEGQPYEFGFCGKLTKRRIAIINALVLNNLPLHLVLLFGEERDKELAKCKALVNIHYGDNFNVFESARCEPWLALGVPIISENSIDNDPRCINTSYDDFIKTAAEFMKSRNSDTTQ